MKIAIMGVAQTKFGELWRKSLADLLAESQLAVIAGAHIEVSDLDAIFTSNMCAGFFLNQCNLGSLATEILQLSIPSFLVEGACASGGLALQSGIAAIESGRADCVLVNGVEKMTDASVSQVVEAIMTASCHEREQMYGATFPALNALVTRLYMHKYGLTREQLSVVSVQNHSHGFLNQHAHLRRLITIDDVLRSPLVADPLRLLDCSPVSDGAASVILCSEAFAKRRGKRPIAFVIGCASATDTLALSEREDLLDLKATRIAAEKAFAMAEITCGDIDCVELHDAFSILQILSLENLGFALRGEGGTMIAQGMTKINAAISINPSGGLKSKGHPVGATGVAQIVELAMQLDGQCGDRQVKDAKIGVAHNMGGYGANVVVSVLKAND